MPYTPPSHRSPASSAPSSPNASRRSSIQGPTGTGTGSTRPSLPRSASYIARHRRTPSLSSQSTVTSASANGSTPDITPPGTSADLKGMLAAHTSPVRQSPSPVADTRAMPPGAMISPPESSSEDEGQSELKSRGRQIENLKELQDAISTIPQHKEGSPSRALPGDLLLLPQQARDLITGPKHSATAGLPALDTGSRKVSHARSITEPHILIGKPGDDNSAVSEENSEQDDPPLKPIMVRKKSGELVRPALRPASLRRPSSMPGTPTYSKAVHFDSHLEHVRHFLQVDRPLAVSAGSSPNDNYESDTEYPFRGSESRSPPFEWELVLNNFPQESPIRKAMPVRLERVWMSPDQKSLLGSVVVANLAFQKVIHCRFTFDYWKTTSEVMAEYSHEIKPKESASGHDRFQFAIKLSDMANLESKTLFFCVRYNVNGREYWDSNNDVNFQVDFRKKMLPQNGKKNFQGASSRPANALPRSNRRTSPSTTPRPKSMPVGALDDFDGDSKLSFDQPIHEFLGESQPLRLKSSKSTSVLPSDNLSGRLSTPSGQAFGHRYDFGASLSAAMKPSKDSRNDGGLYMKSHKKSASFAPTPTEIPRVVRPMPQQFTASPVSTLSESSPATPGLGADLPAASSIASSSYEEILNKYCFFNGSKQSSPQIKDGTLMGGRYDGSDDQYTHSTNSTVSSTNGSPDMANGLHRGAMHHSLRQNVNPYFHNVHFTAMSASPMQSPSQPSPQASQALGLPAANTPKATPPGVLPGFGTANYVSGTAPFQAQHVNDRFPFMSDAHTSPAIRG